MSQHIFWKDSATIELENGSDVFELGLILLTAQKHIVEISNTGPMGVLENLVTNNEDVDKMIETLLVELQGDD